MREKKTNCTMIVNGIIKKLKSKGIDRPTLITVEYQVDGVRYEITESIKLKSKIIKFGFFPIGQEKKPIMGDIREGSITSVSYNPQNPSEAYITHNLGKINA